MRAALGTFEVTDEERRAIKKSLGFRGGLASREEVKDFALAATKRAVNALTAPDPEDAIRSLSSE